MQNLYKTAPAIAGSHAISHYPMDQPNGPAERPQRGKPFTGRWPEMPQASYTLNATRCTLLFTLTKTADNVNLLRY